MNRVNEIVPRQKVAGFKDNIERRIICRQEAGGAQAARCGAEFRVTERQAAKVLLVAKARAAGNGNMSGSGLFRHGEIGSAGDLKVLEGLSPRFIRVGRQPRVPMQGFRGEVAAVGCREDGGQARAFRMGLREKCAAR